MTPVISKTIELLEYVAEILAGSERDDIAQACHYYAARLLDEHRAPPHELLEARARLAAVRKVVG